MGPGVLDHAGESSKYIRFATRLFVARRSRREKGEQQKQIRLSRTSDSGSRRLKRVRFRDISQAIGGISGGTDGSCGSLAS